MRHRTWPGPLDSGTGHPVRRRLTCSLSESHGCDLRLKSIKLLGFKSFADRTVLEFGRGVSVVVGPNGTGKSNIVDAVSWVLGTQFTRALRADQMDDVVFAGTANRPAHSRAEVTLVMDNSDRTAPLDLDEVAITRRLFRGGTSGYEINGVACRLLDIQELLSDGGLGRRQHLIVGQGRLDTILGGSPVQRREIIEDAAGILKHRVRKAKALRRLDRSEADVVRLLDIVGELERRKRPLQRQVRDAERHEALRSELRSLRLWLGGEELRNLARRSQEVYRERTGLEERVAGRRAEQGRVRAMIDGAERRSERLAAELERDGQAIAGLRTVAARLHGIAKVARERASGLAGRIGETESAYRRLYEEAADLSAGTEQAADRERRAREQAEHLEAELRSAEDRLRNAPSGEVLRADPELAALRSELRAAESGAERAARSIAGHVRSIGQARDRLARQSELHDRLAQEALSIAERLDRIRGSTAARSEDRRRMEVRSGRCSDRVRRAETGRAGASARVDTLEAAGGSTRSPVRDRLKDADGVLGELLDLLQVPEPWLDAVGAALGEWAEALVVDGDDAIGAAMAAIRTGGQGTVRLVAAEDDPAGAPALAVAERWGVSTLVDRLGPPARSGWAFRLLGDVVVVSGWREGWEIVRAAPGVRAVTTGGDLITRFGVAPADPGAGSPNMVAAARRALEDADRELTEARRAESEAAARLDAARGDQESARAEEVAAESQQAHLTGALERSGRARDALAREITGLEVRLAAARRSEESTGRRLAELRASIAAAEAGEEVDSREVLARQRQDAVSRHAEARAAWEESVRVVGAATERHRLLGDRLAAATARLADGADTAAEQAALDHARTIEHWALRVTEVVRHKLAELGKRRERSRMAARASAEEVNSLRKRMAALVQDQEAARSRLGQLGITAAELEVRQESVAERLRREADATEDEALAAMLPAGAQPGAESRVEDLAAQLARIGPINLLAAEEFRELDERYRHLIEQLADLERAGSEIRRAIDILDTEMADLFRTTFEDTARHYRSCFATLFPGGLGELVLTGSDDPLEAGVEIRAQPFGKKVGKLSLLSGGERALAALAFLFAVFKARPGPFHILDEVDAALDEANLGRFLRLVDDFRTGSQLVLITHQQATVRVADTLYGITMAPGGSSRALVRDMNRIPELVAAPAGW